MVIGFHYHIPIKKSLDGRLYTQSFYGLFIDALCKGCRELVVFSYSPIDIEEAFINYELASNNIRIVDLGLHNSLTKRLLRFGSARRLIQDQLSLVDIFLVRSPTPLLPVFASFSNKKKVVMYLVGSFIESAQELPFWRVKTMLIKAFGLFLEYTQRKLARKNVIIGNNQYLLDKYRSMAQDIILIKSTTLTPNDIFNRINTCQGPVIKVLYTGRIDPMKGLFEILYACELVTQEGKQIEFHLAGLPVKGLDSVIEDLMQKSDVGLMRGKVFYHGLLKVGEELNAIYRAADIYIIGSKGMEGFPRTIWEAMANGLPVIASRLGSIPLFLRHEQDAVLVSPGDSHGLKDALMCVIQNNVLRKILIRNGYSLARENTLETQGKKMTDTLKSIANV